MSIKIRPLLVLAFLLLVSFDSTVSGQEKPKVVKAVAPIFFRFIQGDTGVNEVVIGVTINNEGKVTSARTISASIFSDKYLEDAAKRWLFESSPNKELRTAEIKFIMRVMPKGTSIYDLTTIYTYPAQLEIRHEFIEASAPHPPETQNTTPNKKTRQSISKRKRN